MLRGNSQHCGLLAQGVIRDYNLVANTTAPRFALRARKRGGLNTVINYMEPNVGWIDKN